MRHSIKKISIKKRNTYYVLDNKAKGCIFGLFQKKNFYCKKSKFQSVLIESNLLIARVLRYECKGS